MVCSDRALAFLAAHGMEPETVDIAEACAAFLADMELGLAGRGGSLKMIPTYLTADGALPIGKSAAVIDAGGTNFRTALVTYTEAGARIDRLSVTGMPGVERSVGWDEFIAFTAERLAPLLGDAECVGFCFSYPTEETPGLDGRVINLTKQVSITGFEGRLICADLSDALRVLGAGERRIVLLNDTPAVLLSGASLLSGGEWDSLVGLISGTGTNTCCVLPDSAIRKPHGSFRGNMLVNLESGGFAGLPRGDFDAVMDAATTDPGSYLHEKMTSGAYVGELCRVALLAAADEGLLTAAGAGTVRGLSELRSQDADAVALGESALFTDPDDADTSSSLCRAIFDRSARCVCANLSAILTLTDAGGERPACICVDGSMYKRSRAFRPLLDGYMASFTAGTLGRRSAFRTFDNATMLGTAAAALLNT